MYCCNCGKELEEAARFCSVCGTAKAPGRPQYGDSQERDTLSRVREDRKIAGVCGGVARYVGMDVTLVRVLWILAAVFPPLPGFIAYIVCWIAMPQDPLPVYRPTPEAPRASSQTVDA